MDKTKELLTQAQLYQQQMTTITQQKEALQMQNMEIKHALEEVGKAKSDDLYRLTGPILIKATKADIKKDLEEKEQLLSLRLSTLEKSEKKIKEKLEELKEQLTTTATAKAE